MQQIAQKENFAPSGRAEIETVGSTSVSLQDFMGVNGFATLEVKLVQDLLLFINAFPDFSTLPETRGSAVAHLYYTLKGSTYDSFAAHSTSARAMQVGLRQMRQEHTDPQPTSWLQVSNLDEPNIDLYYSIKNVDSAAVSKVIEELRCVFESSVPVELAGVTKCTVFSHPNGIQVFRVILQRKNSVVHVNFAFKPELSQQADRRRLVSRRQEAARAKLILKQDITDPEKQIWLTFGDEIGRLDEPDKFLALGKKMFYDISASPSLCAGLIDYLARTLRFNARFPLHSHGDYLLPKHELNRIAYFFFKIHWVFAPDLATHIQIGREYASALLMQPNQLINTIMELVGGDERQSDKIWVNIFPNISFDMITRYLEIFKQFLGRPSIESVFIEKLILVLYGYPMATADTSLGRLGNKQFAQLLSTIGYSSMIDWTSEAMPNMPLGFQMQYPHLFFALLLAFAPVPIEQLTSSSPQQAQSD